MSVSMEQIAHVSHKWPLSRKVGRGKGQVANTSKGGNDFKEVLQVYKRNQLHNFMSMPQYHLIFVRHVLYI